MILDGIDLVGHTSQEHLAETQYREVYSKPKYIRKIEFGLVDTNKRRLVSPKRFGRPCWSPKF